MENEKDNLKEEQYLEVGLNSVPVVWPNPPSITKLKEDLDYAKEENQAQKINIEGWRDLRNTTGLESGNKSKDPNKSKYQPKIIRRTAEWRYPKLSEPYLSSEKLFEIRPRTAEDEEPAKLNELLLNWQFNTQIDLINFIDRFVRTLVDEGTCICRVGWDRQIEEQEVVEPVYHYRTIRDPKIVHALDEGVKLFNNKHPDYENIPDDMKKSIEHLIETGKYKKIVKVREETSIKNVITKNQPSLNIMDTGSFFVDPSCDGDFKNAQYMIRTYEATKSDLYKKNIFHNLDIVDWERARVESHIYVDEHESRSKSPDNRSNTDKAKVIVYEYWGYWDINNDGKMKPIVVSWIGDTIIQMEENKYPDKSPPFIIVTYMPILHSVYGEADASLIQDHQRLIGALSRGIIDLFAKSANAQTAYAKGSLDTVNRALKDSGQDYEFNPSIGDPSNTMRVLEYPQIPESALTMIQQYSNEAEALSGVKGFSSGLTGEAFGKVVSGMNKVEAFISEREMSILRRITNGLIQIGRKIVSMNSIYLQDTEMIRVTNSDYLAINRDQLKFNLTYDLVMDISTPEKDEARANDLVSMLQTMGPNLDIEFSKIILAEIAHLKRMPVLSEKIKTWQPAPNKQKQLEELQLQVEIEKTKMEIAKLQAETNQIETETKMEIEGVTHQRNMEQQKAQSKGNQNLKIAEKILDGEYTDRNLEAAVGFTKIT